MNDSDNVAYVLRSCLSPVPYDATSYHYVWKTAIDACNWMIETKSTNLYKIWKIRLPDVFYKCCRHHVGGMYVIPMGTDGVEFLHEALPEERQYFAYVIRNAAGKKYGMKECLQYARAWKTAKEARAYVKKWHSDKIDVYEVWKVKLWSPFFEDCVDVNPGKPNDILSLKQPSEFVCKVKFTNKKVAHKELEDVNCAENYDQEPLPGITTLRYDIEKIVEKWKHSGVVMYDCHSSGSNMKAFIVTFHESVE